MENELNRLSTYQIFPMDSPASVIRLAEAGFYYEGNEDEVTCFQCHLKHSKWEKGQEPIKIHALLSPGCIFVSNHPKTVKNELINQQAIYSQPVSNNNFKTAQNIPAITAEASGGSDDIQNTQEAGRHLNCYNQNDSHLSKENLVTKEKYNEHQYTKKASLQKRNNLEIVKVNLCSQSSPPLRILNQTALNQTTFIPLGVTTARPKYPAYAIESVRYASYQKWPSHLKQKPNDLAKSGFFYEGKCSIFYFSFRIIS